MTGDPDIAAAAALLAEPARAALVVAVMDEEQLSASELAARACIAPSTASEHLARLVAGGFLTTGKNGRHRYYRIADATVAEVVEALARVAPQRPVRSLREAARSELMRYARTCYDHLAGQLGVAIAQGLERRRALTRNGDDYVLGPNAETLFAGLGIDIAELRAGRRTLVRGCLDWSERERHLAGALGGALTRRLFELDWIRRRHGNRSVELTDEGRVHLEGQLKVDIGVGAGPPHAAGSR